MHKAKRSLLPSYYKAYKHLLNFRCCISNESGSHFGHLAPDGLLDLFQNNNWPGKDSKKKWGKMAVGKISSQTALAISIREV